MASLTSQVIEYLMKKGYSRTEAMLRQESANVDKDGRPILGDRAEDYGADKYRRAFEMLNSYVDSVLDIYKVCSVCSTLTCSLLTGS